MKKIVIALLVASSIALSGCSFESASSDLPQTKTHQVNTEFQWKQLRPGLAFASAQISLQDSSKNLILVKIDPQQYIFHIYQNKNQASAKNIREIHQQQNVLVSLNGAFFGENFEPLGLLTSEGKEQSKLRKSELMNGIFEITKEGEAKLWQAFQFKSSGQTDFAIQNGPILLDKNRKIVAPKTEKTASRTAIGLDKNNHILVVILKQSLFQSDNEVTLYEFARILKEQPLFQDLGLHSVLNLDGGPSTGLMIGDAYYPEIAKIQNIITIHPQ
jgi:uncharacterized protein YigE (DUF2233 family)